MDSANPSKVIPNAKFRIEAVDGSFGPAEFVTDQNGEIDLSELPTGAYVVTELDCPGYIIDEAQRIINWRPTRQPGLCSPTPSSPPAPHQAECGRFPAGWGDFPHRQNRGRQPVSGPYH